MKKRYLVLPLLFSSQLSAQVLKVDLEKDLKSASVVNLYDPAIDKAAGKLPSLARLKYFETRGKWTECNQLAPKVFAETKDLKGWVGLSWMACAEKDRQKNRSIGSTVRALQVLDRHANLRTNGPWSKDLDQSWLNAKYALIESQSGKKSAMAAKNAEKLLDESARLSRDQKSFLYQVLGDQALVKKDYSEARFFFEESLDQKENRYSREKVDFLIKAGGGTVPVKTSEAMPTEVLSEDEKIEERVRGALKQNDMIVALKDTILILNSYSGSRAAKRLKDKPIEIYNAVVEAGKEKALSQMEEADASRLLEWAQSLHRRADFKASLQLAQKAIGKNPTSPQMVSLLWVAGRSAHFIGSYDKAQEYYKALIETQSGSDEAAEALFRSALLFYRSKDYGSVTAQLEKLLVQKRDRYELNAQYWMVRALERIAPERAKTQRAQLIERFPFSYYGLRLAGEQNGNKLTWPSNDLPTPKLKSVIYLVGEQAQAWKRFVTLSGAGWVSEAQTELMQRPYLWDATLKISLAKKLSDRKQFPVAIRLINEAFENDASLRKEEFLKISYPQIFEQLFEQEATRYNLDPILVKSLTRQESAFNLRAVSTSNALGLMQMIPPTAQEVARKLSLKVELPEDMFRPEINIPMGTFYLSQVLTQFDGNVPMGLAAYNAGPYRLNIWLDSRPETAELRKKASSAAEDEVWFDELPWNETSFYIKAILRNVLLYRMIEKRSFEMSPVLWQDLLNKKAK
ncbi:Soluble lytic murein transglycosylase precursor [compost metagenome]